MTKAERKSEREGNKEMVTEKERSTGVRQLLFKTTEKKKTGGTDTEKQVGCTAPAPPLFIQIKPGGLFERLCVFLCAHAFAFVCVSTCAAVSACVCINVIVTKHAAKGSVGCVRGSSCVSEG